MTEDQQIKTAAFMKRLTGMPHPCPLSEWRWFLDGDLVIMEPRMPYVAERDVNFVTMQACTHTIQCVYRDVPRPGVYLQFIVDTTVLQ